MGWDWDGISPDRSISRSHDGDKKVCTFIIFGWQVDMDVGVVSILNPFHQLSMGEHRYVDRYKDTLYACCASALKLLKLCDD